MKKLIYGALFLAVVGMVSCKKEVIQNTGASSKQTGKDNSIQNKSGSVFHSDGRMLIFKSSEAYDAVLTDLMRETDENLESNLIEELLSMNYTSYSEYLSSQGEGQIDRIEDDLLGAILNEDFIFQVGDYIYRINKENEKVFVLPATNISEYEDLVTESKSNPNVRRFSVDDDVIDLAESGATGEAKGIFCNDRKANKKNKLSSNVTVLSNPTVEMNIEAMYNKYGVYFTLKAIGQHHQNYSELKYYFQINNSSWTQRCGSSVSNYSHPWRTKTSGSQSGGIYSEKFKFYSGMKQLKNYRYELRFRCENWFQPSSPNPYTVYFTDYVLIEDF